jgi:serine protease inhibitor ecotin
MKKELRAIITAILLAAFFSTVPYASAAPAQKSKNQGEPKTEKQLVREVYELVMLPYYSVFATICLTRWCQTL